MSRRRHRKPSDPAEIARINAERRRNPALWGVNEEALALAANADVVAEKATRKNEKRAQRFDVFARLHATKDRAGNPELPRHALEAVRRLQEDMAILHRTTGGAGSGVKVDFHPVMEDFARNRIAAGERISEVRLRCGPYSWRLLETLCQASAVEGRDMPWRSVVVQVYGEHHAHAQSALLKAAAHNLSEAYAAIDMEPRRITA